MASNANHLPAGGITAYIVKRYHEDLRRRLPFLIAQVEEIVSSQVGQEEFPEEIYELLCLMTRELYAHMEKEEKILFPMIEAGSSSIKMVISTMESDHEEHWGYLRKLTKITNDYRAPESSSAGWSKLYDELKALHEEISEHMNLENNVLFPRALGSFMP